VEKVAVLSETEHDATACVNVLLYALHSESG